jgi:3-oxoadipate enol-lactonase
MAFVRAGELTVHYTFDGPPGAPVVLLGNSLGTNFHLWDEIVPALARTMRVLRYDMRGHGLSDAGHSDAYAMQELADDAIALLDALDIPRVRYMGLSIGGLVGQALAASYPARVDALVLCATANQIGPPSVWDDRIATIRAGGLAAIAPGVMQRWFTARTHAERPDLIRGFTNMLERTTLRGYVGCALAIRDADLRAADATIACPTLVVSGIEDAVTPPSAGETLCNAIPGARFLAIDGTAHIIAAERPDALLAGAAEFLHEPVRA